MKVSAPAIIATIASLAAAWLFAMFNDAADERRQLADDLYQVCRSVPAAFPSLRTIEFDPRDPDYLKFAQTPFFSAQADLERACADDSHPLRMAALRAQNAGARKPIPEWKKSPPVAPFAK